MLKKTKIKLSSACLMSGGVKENGNCGFLKCWDMKIKCFKDVSIFSCISWIIQMVNTGSTGQDLVDFFEVLNMIQKVLESIRNH